MNKILNALSVKELNKVVARWCNLNSLLRQHFKWLICQKVFINIAFEKFN